VIALRRASADDAADVAEVYLASFKAALPGIRLVHSDDEVRAWIREQLIPGTEAWVAVDGDHVVALMALSPGWIEQLYVAPDRLGEGIGRRLLDHAKARAEGSLELWTFQANDRARRFYERNAFAEVERTDGAGNEAEAPDIRYRWAPGDDGRVALSG
jgi:GNAT superfamily N-acetyltransferase